MAESTPKLNVLFVCLGNICRSPMAEGVLRSLASKNRRIGIIDSAGTGAYHTMEPPDDRTIATLRKQGVLGDYDHGARQVMKEDFEKFDYIFAMDGWNLRDLEKMQRRVDSRSGTKSKAKVMLFGEFAGTGKKKSEEVGDPYYGADGGFDEVYEQVSRFSKNFLTEVVDNDS